MDAVRIIREMRTATRGQCPRFAIWGKFTRAFSSNKGEDFPGSLVGNRRDRKFQCLEVVNGQMQEWLELSELTSLWRTLDAQYWGVPQRRKRIFLVADFTGQCAGEILFVEPRLSEF